MAEGFRADAQIFGWFATEAEFVEFIESLSPRPTKPSEQGVHIKIIKVKQLSHRPKGEK